MPKKKVCTLTASEEELMELFWTKNVPLTSVDIPNVAGDYTWTGGYLSSMLRSLLKKEMIEICGFAQYGTQYARKFIPMITKEEYIARIIMSKGFKESSAGRVALAMVKAGGEKDKSREDLIEQLEEIINELKEREPEKE